MASKMKAFTKDRAQAARDLAVRYEAWHSAIQEPIGPSRDNSLCVWGRLLLESMEQTGVALGDPGNMSEVIQGAARRQDEARIAEAA